MRKELINKIFVAFVISMIVSITTCGIAYLWDKNSVSVSFVKDVFSIVMSLLAPYAAVLLFTDWKAQAHHERSLDLLIEVRSSFSALHRSIMRLKLNDSYAILHKIYKRADFKDLLNTKREEFKREVDKLTVSFDELDRKIKALYLVSDCIDNPFKVVSDEYFKICFKLNDIYIAYTSSVLTAYSRNKEYPELMSDYYFKVRFVQLRYVSDEEFFLDGVEIPNFMSQKYLSTLNDDVDKITKQFKVDL
ncbi:hypothetical protein [Acinetobacter haemolyticus]|uniref:hypothetical protein n=1 Tax=Acinetobacter haemolyticus TaxID=29430 RepID=UPI001372F8AF|nr:hypothetical protein [Acinetobacter haemolyticus]NAR99895.1 hypothetical protein [Acinetobacter haemolyticus]